MDYDIFQFGTLWLDDKIQPIPQCPEKCGDVPRYDGQAGISIAFASTSQEKNITWVKPSGLNLLVADRVLLINVSWQDLDNNGFVTGKRVLIGGQYFRCRLLQTGTDTGVDNEWDEILNVTGTMNGLWHWEDMYFWGKDVIDWDPSLRMVRGYLTARNCNDYEADYREDEAIGFRPVLEPLGSNSPVILGTKLDGLSFRMSSLPGGNGFWPVLQPAQQGGFSDVPNGQQVKMYSFMEDGRPVCMGEQVKDPAKLTLTDRYFGDEFLIPWTISNGVAVAKQSVKQQI